MDFPADPRPGGARPTPAALSIVYLPLPLTRIRSPTRAQQISPRFFRGIAPQIRPFPERRGGCRVHRGALSRQRYDSSGIHYLSRRTRGKFTLEGMTATALDEFDISGAPKPQMPRSRTHEWPSFHKGTWERERERESLHLSSHTGLMQVLPGHPLADTITECSITV